MLTRHYNVERHFRSISEVLKAIEDCDTSFMSGEQLQSLLKLLPEDEEKKTLIGKCALSEEIPGRTNTVIILTAILLVPCVIHFAFSKYSRIQRRNFGVGQRGQILSRHAGDSLVHTQDRMYFDAKHVHDYNNANRRVIKISTPCDER